MQESKARLASQALEHPSLDPSCLLLQLLDHAKTAAKRPLQVLVLQLLGQGPALTANLCTSQAPASVARKQILHTQQVGRAVAHQLSSLAQQISHRPPLLRVDVSGRQDPQSQQMGQPEGVEGIIPVFESFVLLHRRRVHQMHPVASLHQTIHQPVPVERRLHRDPLDTALYALQCPVHRLQLIGQALLKDDPVLLIDDHQIVVVAM